MTVLQPDVRPLPRCSELTPSKETLARIVPLVPNSASVTKWKVSSVSSALGRLSSRNWGSQRKELVADQRQLQKYRNLEARREERSLVHELEMDPNAGQSLKLGHYSFGLSQTITIGVATGLYMSDSPATSLRTKRVIMNAPTVGFATISAVLIANVTTTVGGAEDAFAYSAQSFGNNVDYPTLPPSQKATVTGNYTSLAPAPLANGQSFLFTVRFSGISTIAGGA